LVTNQRQTKLQRSKLENRQYSQKYLGLARIKWLLQVQKEYHTLLQDLHVETNVVAAYRWI